MNIQILFHRFDYLAFFSSIYSIVNIISDNITKNIIIVNNYNELLFDNNSIIIMFLNDLNMDIVRINKNKTILLNTEHCTNFSLDNIKMLENMNFQSNYFIWEYSAPNMNFLTKKYPNINTYYLPLLYNSYLELYYNQTVTKKIDYKNKEIDVLFIGTINERRKHLLDELKKMYKVKIISIEDKLSNKELFDYIENSKLVINIFYYEVFVFDYYRNSLLLANNILMVSEYPYNIDTEIEKNLIDFENKMIFSKYEDIINTVKTTLDQSSEEIEIIVKNTYEWFKEHDMKDYIIKFFETFIYI